MPDEFIQDILKGNGGDWNGAFGSLRLGGHGDNVQTFSADLKNGAEESSTGLRLNPELLQRLEPRPDATEGEYRILRGPGLITSGKRHGDNVMLGGSGDDGTGLLPETLTPPSEGAQAPAVPVGSLATLLQRLLEAKPQQPVAAAPAEGGQGLTQGAEPPGKWSPIKVGSGHSDNVFRGPGLGNQDAPAQGVAAAPEPSSPVQVGSLATLLQRLFGQGKGASGGTLPPPAAAHADRPGLTHANNILMDMAPPERDGLKKLE
jgi:hypothetical protein